MIARRMFNRFFDLTSNSCKTGICMLNSYQLMSPTQKTLGVSIEKIYPYLSENRSDFHTSAQSLAARKGTRARKAKAKVVKQEERIRPFLLKLEEEKRKILADKRPFSKSHYPLPLDDVYFYRKYQPREWSFKDAVQNHREVHHPSVYNIPNSPLILRIDMDFRFPNRAVKCMDPWRGMVEMKAPFLLQGMSLSTVLAIVPLTEIATIPQIIEAGADMAGSLEIIKGIQLGEIRTSEYEFVVCHPSVIPDLTSIRGLMKRNFPNFKTGTIDMDVERGVKRIKSSLKYHVVCSDKEPDYGYVETAIGTLNMGTEDLEGNFDSILRDVLSKRVPGKSPNDYILQCLLKTPHSFEEFKLNMQDAILRTDSKKDRIKENVTETEPIIEEEEKDEVQRASSG